MLTVYISCQRLQAEILVYTLRGQRAWWCGKRPSFCYWQIIWRWVMSTITNMYSIQYLSEHNTKPLVWSANFIGWLLLALTYGFPKQFEHSNYFSMFLLFLLDRVNTERVAWHYHSSSNHKCFKTRVCGWTWNSSLQNSTIFFSYFWIITMSQTSCCDLVLFPIQKGNLLMERISSANRIRP